MFNRDGLFGKKDENPRSDLRPVNVRTDLAHARPPGGILDGAPGAASNSAEPRAENIEFLRKGTATAPAGTDTGASSSQPETASTAVASVTPQRQRSPAPSAEVSAEEKPSKLIVGGTSRIIGGGVVEGEWVVVEGTVEADITARVAEIEDSGLVKGTIIGDLVTVRGRFDADGCGHLIAKKLFSLCSTGEVVGPIFCDRFKVEEGGKFTGGIRPLSEAPTLPPSVADSTEAASTSVTSTAGDSSPAAPAAGAPVAEPPAD